MSLQDTVKALARIVPRPPNTELPAGVSDLVIDEYCRGREIVLSEEVREWLRFTNGPLIGPGGVFGLRTGDGQAECIVELLDQISPFAGRKILPIAGDGCGR